MANRYLCWDKSLIAENCGVQIVAHKPEKKNMAFMSVAAWEGIHNGYASVIRVGDTVRLYYRAAAGVSGVSEAKSVICVAESRDGGITFKRPLLYRHEYGGTKGNNIVFMREGSIDNFSVFYDENPDCPANEKFKALSEWMDENKGRHLCCYVSADGYDFCRVEDIPVTGTFDSFNVVLWDKESRRYFVYFRSYHRPNGDEIGDNFMTTDVVNDIRDIRVATSPDFKNWTIHGRISFEEGQTEYPLYTNQIQKYPRADIFIGFPVRYCDRAAEKRNFDHMPLGDMHRFMTEKTGRGGTALTDCVVMTSRDGFCFNRRDEAFLTPGPEARNNWWYGDGYVAYGLLETESETEGAANEYSMYAGEGYRVDSVGFRRYTVRLDGFFSYYAPYAGGDVLLRPVTVTGDELRINFATSALGGVKITLCDEAGEPIAGYESYEMFGDSVDRPVAFEEPLSALRGKKVSLRVSLKDAHLYFFAFV